MEEVINSQAEGINSDNLDAGTEVATESHESEETTQPKTKKSNVAKLLSQKNEYKKLYEDAKSKLEWAEFWEEKVQAMIDSAVAKAQASQVEVQEKESFLHTYWEEALSKVEEKKAEAPEIYGKLSYDELAKLAWVETTQQTNPNRFSFSGNTPAWLKSKRTPADLSDDELRKAAMEEVKNIAWLGWNITF